MKKRMLAFLLMIAVVFTGIQPVCAEQPHNVQNNYADMDDLSAEQKNSLNMLNYIAVVSQDISASSSDALFIEKIYSDLTNNTWPNAVDERTQAQMEGMLDDLEKCRMLDKKWQRLELIYKQNQASAMRAAVPNPLGLLSTVESFSLGKAIVSVAYMAIDSKTSYDAAMNEAEKKYLEDGWKLEDEKAAVLHTNRKAYFGYMLDIVRQYKIDGLYALTEEDIEDFVNCKGEKKYVKMNFLEDNENRYKFMGDYWLELADCYYKNEEYDKCLNAISEYENLDVQIFRKDYGYANVLLLGIVAAGNVYSGAKYEETVNSFIDAILKNAKYSDWSKKYFVAQAYIELYARTKDEAYLQKAYKQAFDNVCNLSKTQTKLNEEYLNDIEELKITKETSKEEKKEIKKYNQFLKEERKKELPPVYEPLVVNCELLFALADKLNVDISEKRKIASVLDEENGTFLVQGLNDLYSFESTSKEISSITFDGNELFVPASYVTENADISVKVKTSDKEDSYDNWSVKAVDRGKDKDKDVSSFSVTYTDPSIKKQKYEKDSTVVVTIKPKKDSGAKAISMSYKVKEYHNYFVTDVVVFEPIR